ncbi:MAG: HK97 family phage prohead protease [Clostridia bacterium]
MEKAVKEIRLVDMRALDNTDEMIVEGYAAVFDTITDLGWIKEVIDRHAFDNADMSDIVMKYNHESSILPMARTRGGSLQFTIDDHGLKIRAKLPDTMQNKDIYTLIKDGVLSKMSFAFTVKRQEYDYETDTRKILEFDKIFDVSVVDVPAYETTEIYARSKEQYEREKRQYEAKKEEYKLNFEKKKLN